MAEDQEPEDPLRKKVDEKKIVAEFCQLLDKSRQLFSTLRDLPQFGTKHWQTHFGKTFDVYTKLWKFQQSNRTVLDSRYNLKRWQIGEVASKIGQLYYHYYLRTSETNYLHESFAFYVAIRSRAYYSQASKEEKPDLMVKKLRYYARFIVVSLLLNKMDLVKELIQELRHYVEEYTHAYEEEDDDEWRLVISEVTTFVEADNLLTVMTPDVVPVILSHRIKEILGTRDANPKSLSLQEIIIVGNCEKQVKFSELTLDMFRMLQAFEREPEEAPPRTLVTSTQPVNMEISDQPEANGKRDEESKRSNPHKYLLYKPTFSQLYTFLASGFKELPTNSVMLLYISGDPCPGTGKAGSDGPYEQGGIATANKKLTREEESTKRKVAHLKELHCIYPEDLVPFTRKPLVLVLEGAQQSQVFKSFPSLFGQPVVSLMAPAAIPMTLQDSSRKGSLFTLFLYSPLVAFCYICSIADLRSDLWDNCQRQVRKILSDVLNLIYNWSRTVDMAVLQLLDDEFLRLMVLRFVFCFISMHLHRAFKGSDYYPKSFPKLPPEVLQNGNLQKQVLELASMLDVRSLFYDIGDAPPAD